MIETLNAWPPKRYVTSIWKGMPTDEITGERDGFMLLNIAIGATTTQSALRLSQEPLPRQTIRDSAIHQHEYQPAPTTSACSRIIAMVSHRQKMKLLREEAEIQVERLLPGELLVPRSRPVCRVNNQCSFRQLYVNGQKGGNLLWNMGCDTCNSDECLK